MGCNYCTDANGDCAFPYYGLAPHTHVYKDGQIVFGVTQIAPRSLWPENFRPDPDAPDCGVYEYCPQCGAPDKPAELQGVA